MPQQSSHEYGAAAAAAAAVAGADDGDAGEWRRRPGRDAAATWRRYKRSGKRGMIADPARGRTAGAH